MDEKKKTIAVAALGAVLLGVGVFQFIGKPSGAPLPPAKKDATKKTTTTEARTLPNPDYAGDFAQRDPFAKPESVASALKAVATPPSPSALLGHSGGGGATPLPQPTGNISISPVSVPAPQFGYGLSGLIQGRHPAAVFTDPNGNQRLVTVGGSLDGDSRLVAVGNGDVVILFRGKKIKLTVGGAPSEK